MNDNGSQIEQNTGYLVGMLSELLPTHEAIEKSTRFRECSRLHRLRLHRPGIWGSRNTNLGPQYVLLPIRPCHKAS